MKVTLVQPPNLQRSGKWKKQNVYRTPTNLALLAAYVRHFNHEVRICDLDIEGGTVAEMAENLLSDNPLVVGFTCLTPRYPIIVDISEKLKELNPNIIIVVGGQHVSGLPKHILKKDIIDYAIQGEAEESFLEFLNRLESGKSMDDLSNLIYEKSGKLYINPCRSYIDNLDSLPFPAWDLLKLENYTDPAFYKGAHLGIITSRGCPFNCYFCASKVVWGRTVRLRSPENMVQEIREAVEVYKINEFMFYDDTFTLNKKRILQFCEMMENSGLEIRFYAQIRVDTIDKELALRLKKIGCFAVAIGVESGNEKILKEMGKSLTKDNIRNGCKALKDADMPFLASFIIGHPGDTHETIHETLHFADELDADQAKFMIATPYPGTRFFDLAVEKGLIPEEGAEDLGDHTYFQHVAANLSEISDEDLLKYQQDAFDEYDKRKRPLV